METQNDMKISIPKPCHEDWNKMTPNEKGAFCGKCAKTVIDFTKKTANEIKDILTAQTGKTCGKFMSSQLDHPERSIDLLIPIHLLPKKLSFNKAFVVAIFIAFGTTLFSCSTQQGEMVGQISPVTDTTIIKKGEVIESHLTGDTVYNQPDPKIHTNNTRVKTCTQLKGDVDIRQTLGEVAANDTTKKIKPEKDTLMNEPLIGKIKVK